MDYSGINAKIKAMGAGLLKQADYERLCQAGSVESVAGELAVYPAYRSVISQLISSEIHRDLVEQRLYLSLAGDFSRIHIFISDFNIKKYMSAYFLNFGLDIVKLLLCMAYDKREISYSAAELDLLIGGGELNIDAARLRTSKNEEEFIHNLQGASFYSMLTDAFTSRNSLFEIEMQMDLYYYMNLWKRQKKYLDTVNLGIMEKITGSEIDLRNIMWVYRLKKYYNLNDSLIYAYLIPISYRLPRAQLMNMVQSASLSELASKIANSPYGAALGDLSDIEKSYYRQMSKLYCGAAMMHPRSLAYTVGFIFFKQLELRNLTSLLEGARYKLQSREIMDYLNLMRETGA